MDIKHTAWQKQCRDRYASMPSPDGLGMLKDAFVKAISYQTAKSIIMKYEWLGTMSSTTWHYGIYFTCAEGIVLGGVVCIGKTGCTGCNHLHKPYGIEKHEMLVLARGACVHWAPPHTNSKLVAAACRMAYRETCAKLIIAFADPSAGEIGTIYQACNWHYIGKSSLVKQYINPDNGHAYDQAIIDTEAKKQGRRHCDIRKSLLDQGWIERNAPRKYRYVYVLDRKDKPLCRHILSMALPYPKRTDTKVETWKNKNIIGNHEQYMMEL